MSTPEPGTQPTTFRAMFIEELRARREQVGLLAPGSCVIITVARGEPAIGDQITRAYDAAPIHNHSHDEVASFPTGLDLVPRACATLARRMSGWATPAPFHDRPGQILADVEVKP